MPAGHLHVDVLPAPHTQWVPRWVPNLPSAARSRSLCSPLCPPSCPTSAVTLRPKTPLRAPSDSKHCTGPARAELALGARLIRGSSHVGPVRLRASRTMGTITDLLFQAFHSHVPSLPAGGEQKGSHWVWGPRTRGFGWHLPPGISWRGSHPFCSCLSAFVFTVLSGVLCTTSLLAYLELQLQYRHRLLQGAFPDLSPCPSLGCIFLLWAGMGFGAELDLGSAFASSLSVTQGSRQEHSWHKKCLLNE